MTTPTPAASITLARDGVSVAVRVGQVVPMTDGTERIVDGIPAKERGLWLRRHRQGDAWWYEPSGIYADPDDPRPAIDLAKLAEQQAAQPASATVREMVERWQRRMRAIQRTIDAGAYDENGKQVMDARVSTIHECAAELAAALPGGMTEARDARPPGRLAKEIGQLGLTTLALANAAGISADAEESREVDRVLAKPLEHYAARNQAKNDAGFLATDAALSAAGLLGGEDG